MDNLLNILHYLAAILLELTLYSILLAIITPPKSAIGDIAYSCFLPLAGLYASTVGWFLLLTHKDALEPAFAFLAVFVGFLTIAALIRIVLYICHFFRKEKQ